MIADISVWTVQVPDAVAANYINTEDSEKGASMPELVEQGRWPHEI